MLVPPGPLRPTSVNLLRASHLKFFPEGPKLRFFKFPLSSCIVDEIPGPDVNWLASSYVNFVQFESPRETVHRVGTTVASLCAATRRGFVEVKLVSFSRLVKKSRRILSNERTDSMPVFNWPEKMLFRGSTDPGKRTEYPADIGKGASLYNVEAGS